MMPAGPGRLCFFVIALIVSLSACCAPAYAFNTGALHLRCLNNKGGGHGQSDKRLNGLNIILGRGRRPRISPQNVETDGVASQAKETFNSSVSETLLRRMSGWVRSGELSSSNFVSGRAASILESAVDYMQAFTTGSDEQLPEGDAAGEEAQSPKARSPSPPRRPFVEGERDQESDLVPIYGFDGVLINTVEYRKEKPSLEEDEARTAQLMSFLGNLAFWTSGTFTNTTKTKQILSREELEDAITALEARGVGSDAIVGPEELSAAVEGATTSALQALIEAPPPPASSAPSPSLPSLSSSTSPVDVGVWERKKEGVGGGEGEGGEEVDGGGISASSLRSMVSSFLGALSPAVTKSSSNPLVEGDGEGEEEEEAASRFAMASSAGGTVASAVGATLRALGLDSRDYDEQLDEARKALLQSIGVGNAPCITDREDWGDMPTFDLPLAIQMAEYAFDSYNSPAEGSRWVEHPDGSRTAYLSANLIRLLYSGILMLEIRSKPTVSAGRRGGDAASDFMQGGVPDFDGSGDTNSESKAWLRMQLHDGVQEVSLGSKGSSNRLPTHSTFFMYTSRGGQGGLEVQVMDDRRLMGFPFTGEGNRLGNATLSLRELNRTEKRRSHNLELLRGDSSSTAPTIDEDEDEGEVVLGDSAEAEAGPLSSGALKGDTSTAERGEQTTSVGRQGMENQDLVDLEGKVLGDGVVEVESLGTGAASVGGDDVIDAVVEEQGALALKTTQKNSSEAGLTDDEGSEFEFMPWFIDEEGARFGLAEPVEGWTVLDQGSVPPLRGRTTGFDETASAAAVSAGSAAGLGFDDSALERVVALGGEEAKWKEAVGGMTDGQVGEWMLSVGMSKQQVQKAKRAGVNGRVLLEVWWLANRNPKECYDVVGSILGASKDGGGVTQTLAFVQEVRSLARLAVAHQKGTLKRVPVEKVVEGAVEEPDSSIDETQGEGWGKALRRAGMSWWSNSNSNSNNGNDNRKGSEGEDDERWKEKKSEKEKKGGLGQEGKGRPPQSIAIDTQYFSLTDDATAAGEEGNPNMPFSAKLTNALLMERWSLLSSTVESEMGDRTESMAPAQAEAMCFMEVNETDTHLVVWREGKRVIVSFRGTDINWRDFVTDISAFQRDVSYLFGDDSNSTSSQVPHAHFGFSNAYDSVRASLWRVLRAMIPEGGEGYEVYLTGHSLGAALATLCAVDVRTNMPGVKTVMYNFGSPKVGDQAFVVRYNQLVPDSFRVVNDADVFARLPRNKGIGSVPGLTNYFHIGRTVLTSPDRPALWVEGESGGDDPLKDRWADLSDLLDAEVSLMQTLINGRSWKDHVENGYHASMLQCSKISRPSGSRTLTRQS